MLGCDVLQLWNQQAFYLQEQDCERVKAYTHTVHSHNIGKFQVQTPSSVKRKHILSGITWSTEASVVDALNITLNSNNNKKAVLQATSTTNESLMTLWKFHAFSE